MTIRQFKNIDQGKTSKIYVRVTSMKQEYFGNSVSGSWDQEKYKNPPFLGKETQTKSSYLAHVAKYNDL
jgi:hypothetical protein